MGWTSLTYGLSINMMSLSHKKICELITVICDITLQCDYIIN